MCIEASFPKGFSLSTTGIVDRDRARQPCLATGEEKVWKNGLMMRCVMRPPILPARGSVGRNSSQLYEKSILILLEDASGTFRNSCGFCIPESPSTRRGPCGLRGLPSGCLCMVEVHQLTSPSASHGRQRSRRPHPPPPREGTNHRCISSRHLLRTREERGENWKRRGIGERDSVC